MRPLMHATKHILPSMLAAVLPILAIACDAEHDPDGIQGLGFEADDSLAVAAAEPETTEAMWSEFATMEVTVHDDNLVIEFTAHAGYELSYLEVHIGNVPVFDGEFPVGVQSHVVVVPFVEIGAVCGDQVPVAAFALIETPTVTTRTSPVHATSLGGNFVLRCEAPVRPDEARGCTMGTSDWLQLEPAELPAAWWELHEVMMCGLPMAGILNDFGDDAWTVLAQQYLTAKLNFANGAASTEEIDAAMSTAAMLLSPCTNHVGAAIEEEALTLAETIQAYNEGETGPGACPR
jgi:hypothetical protein